MSETIELSKPTKGVTVSAVADMTGGMAPGNLMETDIDQELFRFNSDDTPLMNLMLQAKRVKVSSPEIDHYMVDEPRSSVVTIGSVAGGGIQSTLPLDSADQALVRPCSTLLVPGVDLMLYVTGIDNATNNPIVRAVNGYRRQTSDEFSSLPPIPEGSRCVILSNSLAETQKTVDPELIVPQATRVYLQKRGMNQVVSDYFESQRKHIPFTNAILAEQAISNFKVRGNRTLWAGRPGKFKVNVEGLGLQTVYCTEGLRWQFKREMQHEGKWTIEKIIALAKMFFTGEDVPKTALLLAGKNLLEQIQGVDYSKHPEIQITSKVNSLGWPVTNFHTVFGDIEIKREPTLDRLGWSNSGALIGENRLVHYVYSSEHSFSDRVDGQEATRNGILIWDALALKGSCHIWIDGEGEERETDSMVFRMWDKETAPENPQEGCLYYLLNDCKGISASARIGQVWVCVGGDWSLWRGEASV